MSFVLRKASIITNGPLLGPLSIETSVNCLYQPTQSASLKKYWSLHMPTVSFTKAKVTRGMSKFQYSMKLNVGRSNIYLDQTKQQQKKRKEKIHRPSLICCWKKDLPLNTSTIKNYKPTRTDTQKKYSYPKTLLVQHFFVNMTEKQPWILMNMLADKKKGWTMNNDCNHELKNNVHTYSN